MVGLCYRRGKVRHLVATCPNPRQQYPFEQSLVKGTDISRDFVSIECVDVTKRVDMEKVSGQPYHQKVLIMTMEQGEVSEPLQLWATGNESKVSDTWKHRLP